MKKNLYDWELNQDPSAPSNALYPVSYRAMDINNIKLISISRCRPWTSIGRHLFLQVRGLYTNLSRRFSEKDLDSISSQQIWTRNATSVLYCAVLPSRKCSVRDKMAKKVNSKVEISTAISIFESDFDSYKIWSGWSHSFLSLLSQSDWQSCGFWQPQEKNNRGRKKLRPN